MPLTMSLPFDSSGDALLPTMAPALWLSAYPSRSGLLLLTPDQGDARDEQRREVIDLASLWDRSNSYDQERIQAPQAPVWTSVAPAQSGLVQLAWLAVERHSWQLLEASEIWSTFARPQLLGEDTGFEMIREAVLRHERLALDQKLELLDRTIADLLEQTPVSDPLIATVPGCFAWAQVPGTCCEIRPWTYRGRPDLEVRSLVGLSLLPQGELAWPIPDPRML